MPISPLPVAALRRECDAGRFTFNSTADLDANSSIIGQPRSVRAIEFGIGIRSHGYNVFVLGEAGTGRTTAIRRFLRERTRHEPVPDDWVYVHNFQVPNEPRAIEFPAGEGRLFKKRMEELITALREEIPRVFATDAYQQEVDRLHERVDMKRQILLRNVQLKAEKVGFAVVNTAAGLTAVPLNGDKIMDEAAYDVLSIEQQKQLDAAQTRLDDELEETLKLMRSLTSDQRRQLRELDRNVAESAIAHHFDSLALVYADHDEVKLYLSEVHNDVISQLDLFRPKPDDDSDPDLRRYDVNLFVDNADIEGAPVVVESNPTYYNLIGRIEFEMRLGIMTTHFTNIKPGSLHHANGGYLVIDALDLMNHMPAWEALKRAIKEKAINLNPVERFSGGNVLAKSSDPEPIPLSVKIILLGNTSLYYDLYEYDEDFRELFKVKADFSTTMTRTEAHELEYAAFIANRCSEEDLVHFSPGAVAKVIEFGAWLAGHQDKLSTRFGDIADLVREASFWAQTNGHATVSADDVQQTLRERAHRSNRIEEMIDEQIETGVLYIDTHGSGVGQINGLMVLEYGDYAFAHPGRITVQTYTGESGVVHFDRETNMTDPIHNKGLLTLNGYLGGKYAQERNLTLAASISFEQNYGDVYGDSGSSAELYALLSSLADLPLNQGIAVTGAINQNGDVQPIGAATEKVEGFFRVCQLQGLTGSQGVILPAANVKNLMLNEDVIAAVERGDFNVWAIHNVDEGMEILTGITAGKLDENGNYPDGSIHAAVLRKLQEMARRKHKSDNGVDDEEDDDDEDDEDEDGDATHETDTAVIA